MCLFESESFIQIIKYYKSITFNMLVPVIVKLADNYWLSKFSILVLCINNKGLPLVL